MVINLFLIVDEYTSWVICKNFAYKFFDIQLGCSNLKLILDHALIVGLQIYPCFIY